MINLLTVSQESTNKNIGWLMLMFPENQPIKRSGFIHSNQIILFFSVKNVQTPCWQTSDVRPSCRLQSSAKNNTCFTFERIVVCQPIGDSKYGKSTNVLQWNLRQSLRFLFWLFLCQLNFVNWTSSCDRLINAGSAPRGIPANLLVANFHLNFSRSSKIVTNHSFTFCRGKLE